MTGCPGSAVEHDYQRFSVFVRELIDFLIRPVQLRVVDAGVAVFPAGVEGADAGQFGHPGLGQLPSRAELAEPLGKGRHIPVGRKTPNQAHRQTSSKGSCLKVFTLSVYSCAHRFSHCTLEDLIR